MPQTTSPTLRPSKGWYAARKRLGFDKDAQLAVAMRVDPSTIYRFEKGIGSPSGDFIVKALMAFRLSATEFHQLFAIEQPKRRREVA